MLPGKAELYGAWLRKHFLPGLAPAHYGPASEEIPAVPSTCKTGAGDRPWIILSCHCSSKG